MTTLTEHLAAYGLRNFSSSGLYLFWARQQLGDRKAQMLDRLRKPLEKDDARPDDVLRFYEFIADPEVAAVVHSMKTDAIRASGAAAWECIKERNTILDFGCNIGYLATWYARHGGNAVTGVDISAASIAQARQKAALLGVANVRFLEGDIRKLLHGERFDAIVDTQTVYTVRKKKPVLAQLRALLADDGVFVTLPPARTAEKISAYLELLAQAGLTPRTLEFVYFSALGEPDAYPIITADKTAAPAPALDVPGACATMQGNLIRLSGAILK
ncbi:MAG: class I SAM-dependent methyltransferase [Pseudomonadota bacterium]